MAANLNGQHGGPAHLVWLSLLVNDSRLRTGGLDAYAAEVAQIFRGEPMPEQPFVDPLPVVNADGKEVA